MKLIECPNGHHYNADFFQICPFCEESGNSAAATDFVQPQAERTAAVTDFVQPQAERAAAVTDFVQPQAERAAAVTDSVQPQAERAAAGHFLAGWLVCVAGPDRGKRYEVNSGMMTVGRGRTMDIVLSDPAVSRDRQLILVYDERRSRMTARRGEAKSLCYVDGEPVIMDRILEDRSKLQMGRSMLLYVALCGDDFNWNMYL